VKRALLDTSAVIAIGRAEEISLPEFLEESTISAMTLCELHQGVLTADSELRAMRLATLVTIERQYEVLPIDGRVAPQFGRLVARRRAGHRRPATADALIAATAAAYDLPLITRDRDFEGLDGVEVVLV
jgi:predicted nucleic acid-binding protein